MRIDIASRQSFGPGDDITSFFVTNFPEEFRAWDLFHIFERFGNLCEVVIPHRRDKSGKRFEFVRYKDVEAPVRLAVKLDNLFIDTMKLFVNVSRFTKNQILEKGVLGGLEKEKVKEQQQEKVWKPKSKSIVVAQGVGKSYSEVVKEVQGVDVHFTVEDENFALYRKAMIGEVWQPGKSFFYPGGVCETRGECSQGDTFRGKFGVIGG